MKMNLVVQTNKPLLRFWGNFCGKIADIFLNQSIKYGDLYEVESFLDDLDKIADIDDTIAWKGDE